MEFASRGRSPTRSRSSAALLGGTDWVFVLSLAVVLVLVVASDRAGDAAGAAAQGILLVLGAWQAAEALTWALRRSLRLRATAEREHPAPAPGEPRRGWGARAAGRRPGGQPILRPAGGDPLDRRRRLQAGKPARFAR